MEDWEYLPIPLQKVQKSLHPYVKQRQEISHIRRVLASHLNSCLEPGEQNSLPQPLSLVESSFEIESAPHAVKGAQKEYLQCARANAKARREYAQLVKEQQGGQASAHLTQSARYSTKSLSNFLELVKQQQKHDLLCIGQDCIDTLSKKPAAATGHLDPEVVLKDVESLPQVPPEVIRMPGTQRDSGGVDLKDLLYKLEKSVLRAKMLLKREQKLLAKFRSEKDTSNISEASRLQALGTARNELINWIETELSQAGESSGDSEEHYHPSTSEHLSQDYIDAQLAMISRQYTRYTKARQSLAATATGHLSLPLTEGEEGKDSPAETAELKTVNYTSHITLPYLEDLVSISNQQKALAQQKSHLTIALAKQLKEASQGLDRLADESHLLPAYPMPRNSMPRRNLETGSFATEMSTYEKPELLRHARAWTYSSESAATSTKAAILEKLEEGSIAIDNSRHTLLELRGLIGGDIEDLSSNKTTKRRDIWAEIEGSLGAI